MEAKPDPAEPNSLARLELSFKEIVLDLGGDPSAVPDDDAVALKDAVRWVEELFNTGIDVSRTAELQAMVAVQLAPRAAVDYAQLQTTPRFRLVQDHLVATHGLDPAACEALARRIAGILGTIQRQRRSPGATVDDLMRRDGSLCRICRLSFNSEPECVRQRDPLKPHWEDPELLTRPEIDHILPIAAQGSDRLENLQLLCRACNLAKSDGLRIHPRQEIRFAASRLADIDRMHRFRMLQWKIARGAGICETCGSSTAELTVRLRHPEATYSRPNLVLKCYDCVG